MVSVLVTPLPQWLSSRNLCLSRLLRWRAARRRLQSWYVPVRLRVCHSSCQPDWRLIVSADSRLRATTHLLGETSVSGHFSHSPVHWHEDNRPHTLQHHQQTCGDKPWLSHWSTSQRRDVMCHTEKVIPCISQISNVEFNLLNLNTCMSLSETFTVGSGVSER